MACFLVPMGEAIVTTVVQKVVDNKEKKAGEAKAAKSGSSWGRRLGWLNKMLWGGVILLALEHVWHGEVVPWPPFLTAMENPADVGPMLSEMALFGGAMAAAITVIWAIIVWIEAARAKATPRLKVKESPAIGGA